MCLNAKLSAIARVLGARATTRSKAPFWKLLLGGCLFTSAVIDIQGQGLIASGTLSSTPAANHLYNYTLQLENSSASASSIQTFWYAWLPGGGNYLPSSPSNVQAPVGWTTTETGGGPGDGYSLRFETSTAPLLPGSALTFTFTSPDSPASLAGTSPLYPGVLIGSSEVYSGHIAGTTANLLVQSIPEPSTLVLLAPGLGLLLAVGRRKIFQTR
jgi:hypothetical protein